MKNWLLGCLAGFVLGSYLTLSCAGAKAQSAEVASAIHAAAVRHGVSEAYLFKVSWCESRWSPSATSRGGHRGLFQFSDDTWRWMSWQAGLTGASPYDAWAAADVAAWAFRNGYASHWSCR